MKNNIKSIGYLGSTLVKLKNQKATFEKQAKALMIESFKAFKHEYGICNIYFDYYRGHCPIMSCIGECPNERISGSISGLQFSENGEDIENLILQFPSASLSYDKYKIAQYNVELDYLQIAKYVISQVGNKRILENE